LRIRIADMGVGEIKTDGRRGEPVMAENPLDRGAASEMPFWTAVVGSMSPPIEC
jgi:hypothetical protein